MKKVMIVFGTRPEAIKMCPVIKELNVRKNIKTVVCVTGQHKEMLQQVLDCFKIVPDYNLQIMKEKQNLFDITINIIEKIKPILETEKPDLVLVHGDTSTTFVTSLCCYYLKIPVGHVEAGLRTHDIYSPFPEEFNRQAVGIIAKYNFSPTSLAKNNLIAEGKDPNNIFITGNTVIDSLKYTINSNYNNHIFDWVGNNKLIILTVHRRENLGKPLKNIFKAVKRIASERNDIRIIYPMHKNVAIRDIANEILKNESNIKLIEPLDVIDFHNFLARSYFVVTDSGGIQEEAPALGKPVLVLRNVTERPEGVENGTLKLIGTEEENVYKNLNFLLDDKKLYEKMSKAVNPYGDGTASRKIVDIIENLL